MIQPRDVVISLDRTATPDTSRQHYLRLDRNELVPHLREDYFQEILASLTPASFSAYPAVWPLYELLASSLGVEAGQLLLGAGSDWLIRACFDTFVDEDAEVVLPVPTYGMYAVYAKLRNARLTLVDHHASFEVPVAAIKRALASKPRLLALSNPNGALGSSLDAMTLLQIVEVAAQGDTLVVVDEAYVEYGNSDLAGDLANHGNLVLIRTFSKACGLAGLRLGYAVGSSELIGWLEQVRPNVEINEVAVAAGRYLLRNPDIIRDHTTACLAGKRYLADRLRKQGFEVFEGSANFVQVRFGSRHRQIHKALRDASILVKDQTGAGILDGWTRVTVGPTDVMQQVVDLIDGLGSG
jgi:histidinol-phosphate aminotransferase